MSNEIPPLSTHEFLRRLDAVEADLRSVHDNAHNQNGRVAAVIDEVRVDLQEAEARLTRIEKATEALVGALEGSLGFAGIVKTQAEQGQQIQRLIEWRAKAGAFWTGICFAVGLAFTALNYFLIKE